MSSSHDSETRQDPTEGSEPKRPAWAKDSLNPQFIIESEDIDESVLLGKEWYDKIESRTFRSDNYVLAEFLPTVDDAIMNSRGSDDKNILHEDPDLVREFTREYEELSRKPFQDGAVVVSQGMNFKDIITHEGLLSSPVTDSSGSWKNMVFAAESRYNSDQVILSSDSKREEFRPVIIPANEYGKAIGESDTGKIGFEYSEEPDRYTEDHNLRLNALEDMAVGRGPKTPSNIRYGELLVSNQLSYDPTKLDPEKLWEADRYVFELDEFEESKYQVEGNWAIDLYFNDEAVEDVLSYTENSLYVEGFHSLDSIGN